MVNFLIIIDKIPQYSKLVIDKGYTPQKVYEICSYIRETFCLSYSIRKFNNLYLYLEEKFILIKFEGSNLRYLGPDERSQALLLNKALTKIKNGINFQNNYWIKSTPGIFVRRFPDNCSFLNFYKQIATENSYLIINNNFNFEENVKYFNTDIETNSIMENDFFLIPIIAKSINKPIIIKIITEVKNIKLLDLSKIKNVENKILYINFLKDRQINLNY